MVEEAKAALILVVEEIHETRQGIERLLKADGYSVAVSKDEPDAIQSVQRTRPDLILVSLAGSSGEVLATVRRIREQPEAEEIPIVFWVEDIDEGEEVAMGENVYLMRPDNFNQLRGLLARVLDREIMALSSPENEL
jgi:CheY-like chemotaxis protein